MGWPGWVYHKMIKSLWGYEWAVWWFVTKMVVGHGLLVSSYVFESFRLVFYFVFP